MPIKPEDFERLESAMLTHTTKYINILWMLKQRIIQLNETDDPDLEFRKGIFFVALPLEFQEYLSSYLSNAEIYQALRWVGAILPETDVKSPDLAESLEP